MTELVQLYDADGDPAGTADRARVRAENLTHAATAVVVRDPWGRVHVHRRTDTKDVYPGRHDFAAGGVVAAGEEPRAAAARELAEELGITGVTLEPVGVAHYGDDHTDYWGHCFTTTWGGEVTLQPEEVAWGDWWPLDRLVAAIDDDPEAWTPDTAALLGGWLRARVAERQDVEEQGWDSHTELVEGRWIDRTPRRPEVVPALTAEAALLPRLAPRLPLAVPVPLALGGTPPRFRHERVPGRPVRPDRLTADDGRRLGHFLRVLHDTPAELWASTGLGRDTALLPELDAMVDQVVPLLPADLRDAGSALLARLREAAHRSVLRHGDVGPSHLLTTDGRLTGVIDWTDAALGDPALDLAWAVHGTPQRFADALVSTYGATPAELARGRDWHLLGPWWEVQHGLAHDSPDHVDSGLAGAVERLRATP
ncbi:phosphotransferase [Nocardioides coralli]|uniref:phosphotransferase n=1 Tax=Nocardioides coralli TaxID=2872154 RepID=UPI001CA3B93B|nr:phosphotransferase [Nocardioides coralli]QZY28472.1 phosphotransferase [Nocardioides coralli]